MKFVKIFIVSLLIAFIFLPAIWAQTSTEKIEDKIESELLENATKNPEETFSVIITFTKKPEDYKEFVKAVDGKISYDYSIIEGLAVKIQGKNVEKLIGLKNLIKVHKDEKVYALLHDSAPLISADKVWAQGITGKNIRVCVIDTGVDFNHPAITQAKNIGCYHFLGNGADVGPGCMDDNGHGTHVTGIVTSNDPYSRGVANGTLIMAVKVLDSTGSGYASDVIKGIEYCTNNSAQVISMSLGAGWYSGTCDTYPTAQAVNNAAGKGVPSSVAAGNIGSCGISSPACASKAIAVGAIDKQKRVVGWSSKGSELDIVAPGVYINSTVLNNGWSIYSGTSMAAPHVSGVIALMLEKNSSLTPLQIRKILNETSDPVTACYESCKLVPAGCLCSSDWYKTSITCTWSARGAGIVNASRAVDAVPGVWKYISITLFGYPVNFGNFDPGTSENPAPNNGNYKIRVDPETNVNVNVYQKGNDYVSGSNVLGIGNMTWYNSSVSSSSIPVTKNYSIVATNVASGTNISMYYWIDIPQVKAGDYNTTIFILANETS